MLIDAVALLRVRSIGDAERFYCSTLGFEIESRFSPRDGDPTYLVIRRDRATIHISSFEGDGQIGHVVTIATNDIDGLARSLISADMDVGAGVMDQDWGGRELYVRDPDGNCIRFQAR